MEEIFIGKKEIEKKISRYDLFTQYNIIIFLLVYFLINLSTTKPSKLIYMTIQNK
jgi:hypothetical protein